jgi:NAD+ kinase
MNIVPVMKKVGIIAKTQRTYPINIVIDLVEWLRKQKIEVIFDIETADTIGLKSNYNRTDVISMIDLLIVLGGDGTFLSAARLIGGKSVPIIGVNLGSLGFLTEVTREEIYPVLDRVLKGDFEIEDRMMLDIKVLREGEKIAGHKVLNDVVVNKGALARIIDLDVKINNQFVTSYRSDGLIISTPTGSTAYSLAAGGPIVYPSLHALILAPICPFNLTNRPIIIPDSVSIEIQLATDYEDVHITLDGQVGLGMKYKDVLEIKRSQEGIKLIKFSEKNHYEILRKKLKWGER